MIKAKKFKYINEILLGGFVILILFTAFFLNKDSIVIFIDLIQNIESIKDLFYILIRNPDFIFPCIILSSTVSFILLVGFMKIYENLKYLYHKLGVNSVISKTYKKR